MPLPWKSGVSPPAGGSTANLNNSVGIGTAGTTMSPMDSGVQSSIAPVNTNTVSQTSTAGVSDSTSQFFQSYGVYFVVVVVLVAVFVVWSHRKK
jgi:hypothetical protein